MARNREHLYAYYQHHRRRQKPLRLLVQETGDFLHLDLSVLSISTEAVVRRLWPESHQNAFELTKRVMKEPENWLIQQRKGSRLFEPFYQIWRKGSDQGYWFGRGLHMDTLWALWKGARDELKQGRV